MLKPQKQVDNLQRAEELLHKKFEEVLDSPVYDLYIRLLDKEKHQQFYFEADDDRQVRYAGEIDLRFNRVKLFKEMD